MSSKIIPVYVAPKYEEKRSLATDVSQEVDLDLGSMIIEHKIEVQRLQNKITWLKEDQIKEKIEKEKLV